MKARVLISDPCPSVRWGARFILQETGGGEVVGEAACAEQTILLARNLTPDWVVLDPDFGHGAGQPDAAEWANVCRRLKSLRKPPRLITHTYRNAPEYLAALMSAGVDHYVHKDVEFEEIATARKRAEAGERVWLLGPRAQVPPDQTLPAPEDTALTAREREVLALKLQRYRNKEIAGALHISVETVKRHVTSINRKQGRISTALRLSGHDLQQMPE